MLYWRTKVIITLNSYSKCKKARHTSPILSLDDVVSHLDKQYREAILEEILDIDCQTWISDVNDQNFSEYKGSFKFFTIENNQILNYG